MIVAAAQEERFRAASTTRVSAERLRYCLDEAGISLSQVDHVAFYDKPFLKFERLLETYLAFAPRGFKSFRMAMPLWLREKLFQKDLLAKEPRLSNRDVDWLGAPAVFAGTPPEPRGQRVLRLAVRRGACP